MTIIPNSRELRVVNWEMLPKGTGARYMQVTQSHIPGTLIASCWRRSLKAVPADAIVIDYCPNKGEKT